MLCRSSEDLRWPDCQLPPNLGISQTKILSAYQIEKVRLAQW
uniref:Uncharacterized protein n=1 Tax=Arundo donax TaxID=35708 RepID=A0A0A9HDG4_ARUDO